MTGINKRPKLVITNQDIVSLLLGMVLLFSSFSISFTESSIFFFLLMISFALILSIFNHKSTQIIIIFAVITSLVVIWRAGKLMVFGNIFTFFNFSFQALVGSWYMLIILGVLIGILLAFLLFYETKWFKYSFIFIITFSVANTFSITSGYIEIMFNGNEALLGDYLMISTQIYFLTFLPLSIINSLFLGISFLIHGNNLEKNTSNEVL